MGIHIRNVLIALAVAFVISLSLALLMTSAGAQTGIEVPFLGSMAGAFTFYILWNLSGNRKVAGASAEQRERALTLAPPEGHALVYVLRRGFVAKAAGMDISLDGVLRAQLRAPQFTCFAAAPGAHRLSAAFGGGAGAQSRATSEALTLVAGQAVGVLMTVKMGALQGSIVFETLTGQALQQTIRGMAMVAPIES